MGIAMYKMKHGSAVDGKEIKKTVRCGREKTIHGLEIRQREAAKTAFSLKILDPSFRSSLEADDLSRKKKIDDEMMKEKSHMRYLVFRKQRALPGKIP